MDALRTFNTRHTPQTQPAKPGQVKNAAGGYVFRLDPLARARRFLILGTDSPTYYTSNIELTSENGQALIDLCKTDHAKLVELIVDVSTSGAAPKPGPALFALAIASSYGTAEERAAALARLPEVARTGTHLFQFLTYVLQFRSWGRGLRTGISRWYEGMHPDKLAYQVVKYRSREGWTHQDVLNLAHPKRLTGGSAALADWITKGNLSTDLPDIVDGYLAAQEPGVDLPGLIREFGLSWEMLPTQALTDPAVWDALLDRGLPMGALIRQLPRLTNLGVLRPLGGRTVEVAARLRDPQQLRKARVHPVTMLNASRVYASGRGMSQTWEPVAAITEALEQGFYAAFDAVEPTGKRTLLALDVSGSMGAGTIAGMALNPREASAALALVTVATEPNTHVLGFTDGSSAGRGYYGWGLGRDVVSPLPLRRGMSLGEAIRAVSNLSFGGTDCALPVQYALERGLEVDTFVIYTDNETWSGGVHVDQALRDYRNRTGIDARMVVVGMTATEASIADPDDPGMLDVVGFDTATPQLIADFSARRI